MARVGERIVLRPMGTADPAPGLSPMGDGRGLSSIVHAVTHTLNTVDNDNGWECGICMGRFAYGDAGRHVMYGCATCGNGICIQCATASYAMAGMTINACE